MTKSKSILYEKYTDSLSDDEKNALDMSYFDIGQGDEETTANSYCWIWSRPDQGLRIKKGGTHGHNFSHEIAGNTFKGWYDPEKGMISVVFPPYEERKLGNRRPTEDDIPQQVYQALIRAFGKRKPKFLVFESKMLNEISYDIDDELDVDEYTYGGWLDPNGKFHAVNYEGHLNYAKKILEKLGRHDYKDAYSELYRLGFIRIVLNGTTLFYKNKSYDQQLPPPSSRMIKSLKDLAIERGCTRIVDCETNKEMSDIGESVVLTEQSLVGLKFWWMDNNYQLHPVKFEQHRYWAEAYLRMAGYTDVKDVYKAMYKLGFIRVVKQQFGGDMMLSFQYSQEKPINSKQLKALKDLAIEEDCEYFIDDTTHREVRLAESIIEATAEKEKQVKSFISQMNDDSIVVTVSREDELPAASYVQVDGFVNGQNVFSSNPEDLVKWGFQIPSTQEFLKLPRGRYKLGDAKAKLKMSLKEVRQLFQPDGERRWWMDTKGRIYDVSKEGHSAWGAKYITDKFGPDHKASQYANSDFHAPYQLLFGAGWVRMLYMSDNKVLAYEYDEHQPSSLQMTKIKRLAKDLKAGFIYNERTNRTETLEENISEDMSYNDLLKLTTPERKDRASNVTARSLPVSTENGLETWNFRYKSSPQTTVTDKPFRGSISFIKGKVGQNNDAMKMKCKVDCECPDFMYRFAYNDAAKGASQVGPDSLSGCANRRPKPAYDYGEGLCKHLTALGRFLKTKIQATKKSNLFEAIDDVTNQGPFNVTYYD